MFQRCRICESNRSGTCIIKLITETVDILGEIEEDAPDAVSEKCRTGATDDQLKGTT
jgi:hypothetical protein